VAEGYGTVWVPVETHSDSSSECCALRACARVFRFVARANSSGYSLSACPIGRLQPHKAITVEHTLPEKIDRYPIKRFLGRGGMGIVYLGDDPLIGREVAIKILPSHLCVDETLRKQFLRGIRAGFLDHTNIVRVYGAGEENGIPFIVMEYAEGEELKTFIDNGVKLSLIEKLTIINQVCQALGYAHEKGVVHRDIKPANVMVRRDSSKSEAILAKILDFGIAKIETGGDQTSITSTTAVFGTAAYMAPERFRGQRGDGRVDLWATGVMLYLLLTDHLPFVAGTETIDHKVLYGEYPPLRQFMPDPHPLLEGAIERSLAKDPDLRYSTAEEFSADLRSVIDVLKKDQVKEFYADAQRLSEGLQFGQARDLLNQIIRIDPLYQDARSLLKTVNLNISRLRRAEQVREALREAEASADSGRYIDALNILKAAANENPDNEEISARLDDTKSRKQRQDEIDGCMSRAESLRERGDLTGALSEVERAYRLNEQDTHVRSIFTELSREVRIAERQKKSQLLLGQAEAEYSRRNFTGAIALLQEIESVDPENTGAQRLMQKAIADQEEDRRRKILDQIQQQIEKLMDADDWARASELLDRALEKLPSEPTLLRQKATVALQLKRIRLKHQIDIVSAQAQELYARAPSEALLVVQRGIQELGTDERLLSLEATLRERMQSAEKEEIRSRYMRDAQAAIDRGDFAKAVEILESYQYEFSDAAGVESLLEMARGELTQQVRRERIASAAAQAKTLMDGELYQQALRVLEPAIAETNDPSLARLLAECHTQLDGMERRTDAMLARVARLREQEEFGEAIELLQGHPAVAQPGSKVAAALAELRNESERKQRRTEARKSAAALLEKKDFAAAIDCIEKVQSGWGHTPELNNAIRELEAERSQHAALVVAQAIETARTTMLADDSKLALEQLRAVQQWVGFAGPALEADWTRLGKEAVKPRKKGEKQHSLPSTAELAKAAARTRLLSIAGGAVLALLVVVGGIRLSTHFSTKGSAGTKPQVAGVANSQLQAPASGEQQAFGKIFIHGTPGEAEVYVDNSFRGLTLRDGSQQVSIAAGAHTVRISKSGFSDSTSNLTVAVNDRAQIAYNLQSTGVPAPPDTSAYISIVSVPGALVIIDGVQQGSTDPQGSAQVKVNAGSHVLGITKPGYQNFTQNFAAKPGEHSSMNVYPSKIEVAKVDPPMAVFNASAQQVTQGQSVNLGWNTQNASEVSVDPGLGRQEANGGVTVTPPLGSTTYTLTARGNGGSVQRAVTIIVTPKQAPANQTIIPPPPPHDNIDQTPAIQSLMNSFYGAFNAHSVVQMRGYWTGMTAAQAKSYDSIFKDQTKMRVDRNCPTNALDINGNSANWTCTETTTIESGGKPMTNRLQIHFKLKKTGNSWTIDSRN